jgi:hypothetical protein
MIVDTHAQAQLEPTLQKKAWDAPRLTHLQAGSAELTVGSRADLTDKS